MRTKLRRATLTLAVVASAAMVMTVREGRPSGQQDVGRPPPPPGAVEGSAHQEVESPSRLPQVASDDLAATKLVLDRMIRLVAGRVGVDPEQVLKELDK